MKKNIIIILLLVVILGLGGYLVYDKIAKINNEEEVKLNIEEEAYDLTLAKELVDKYYNSYVVGSTFDNMSALDMLKNAFWKTKQDYTCNELYVEDKRATVYEKDYLGEPVSYTVKIDDNIVSICGEGSHIVSYDSMNETYKKLYGKQLEVEKKQFGSHPTFIYYDCENDVFLYLCFMVVMDILKKIFMM